MRSDCAVQLHYPYGDMHPQVWIRHGVDIDISWILAGSHLPPNPSAFLKVKRVPGFACNSIFKDMIASFLGDAVILHEILSKDKGEKME